MVRFVVFGEKMIANENLITDDMRAKAKELVKLARGNNGLAPVDTGRFWNDNNTASRDPFGKDIPQIPLGIGMLDECVFAELGISADFKRLLEDEAWAISLKKAYNDKAEKIVGRRLLSGKPVDKTRQYPPVKGLHDVFEAKNVWNSGSWWLEQSVRNEKELEELLCRVEERNKDLRTFILPPEWEKEKERLMKAGIKPAMYRGQRGPMTFAGSVYGIENTIFLILDNPKLAARFRDAIINTMLNIAGVLDKEAGYSETDAPKGFSFCDDNCAMFNPKMYEFFGYPILKAVFERYSPGPSDSRYQHSDSDMRHQLPALGRLGLTGVNFGPTLSVTEIREHCQRAVIDGQLAPFTFCRNEEENIVLELLRDFEQSKEKRGVRFATAGSVNNGSMLTGLRLVMSAIQRYGRYQVG
ncbi:hypothetical protein COY52_07450 [Candidatus Desantisbacteria bacterium CG_4_10_14_0_8_um_filter_48_22]|uniref:Uroporphyrinogen decarboxylase (URO-D) domain-containing protein n=1 Tax=Candidatus Desantisbacteria bacterium CG_4_10_14_0_8_um_filter_48_22 TaxID=1974543 RepID=A0A2M7S9W2_9BACT|nr:MAG: hypothetical protein AUJ67_06510 [Candidatus Desantisbacteria bacterium CG1_02_49_89]PIV56788.1 MAG: hypothetical protein COS16_02825 [Candidatus Desantisbacteria bacterium CG02_land_8_20_14_3_00_49_13]PIZ16312.1 MAG: hypothetical protein COY52_07450 [Candidatus Desantisbacteria bacterium CG_4_10_14_0_8_um_filter_48_22]